MRIDGSCHCGAITFEGEIDPEKVSVCHCTDCQVSTGSAFRVNVPVPGKDFRLKTGTPAIYVKTTAESGNPREQAFCPACGSPIYSTNPGPAKQAYMVRVGILAQREQLTPKAQNWARSALPWVNDLGGVKRNEKAAG
jgi:hypothetical protein